jgi:hypothetical protein
MPSVVKTNYSSILNYPTWYQKMLNLSVEYIIPIGIMQSTSDYVGALPSVTMNRTIVQSGMLNSYLKSRVQLCATKPDATGCAR